MKVETVDHAKVACKKLTQLGTQTAIITMGEEGAVFATQTSDAEHVPNPPMSEPVRDTTGAGDSFVGALAMLSARCPTMELKEKLKRACQVASQSVTRKGTQTSYPKLEEVTCDLFLI